MQPFKWVGRGMSNFRESCPQSVVNDKPLPGGLESIGSNKTKKSKRIHTQVAAMAISRLRYNVFLSSFSPFLLPSFLSPFILNFLNILQWAFLTLGIFKNVHWVLWVPLSGCSDPKASSCSDLALQPGMASGTCYFGSAVKSDLVPTVQVTLGNLVTQWPSSFLSMK